MEDPHRGRILHGNGGRIPERLPSPVRSPRRTALAVAAAVAAVVVALVIAVFALSGVKLMGDPSALARVEV
jgi:hypothetical protein